ncbi:PhzF family phenazine biosynthesis protein [Neptunomonas antarctica]|uniref:Trans-2,3-dihydro-3-hydroxyanthranilate isomerase n=1 Tax=Neptunomonas antarctica TaxID=619304 RepID=A0A1N7JZJ6_9GAMM|nr:PhzF family phenazine biosynthesis protein [Neptunomonas antarctica]SIS54748.1 trans-2,3-dihydro-3-hydroxyanthranilate isomerase [Neptunomonas antarctica]
MELYSLPENNYQANKPFSYYTLDVFTDTPFGGNPLAVFTDAGHLSEMQMQRIAAELNLSETVFITKQTGPKRWTIRIFMPKGEIPFAGHPTIGTALLIKKLGWLDAAQEESEGAPALILDEQVGPVPVVFIEHANGQCLARFTTAVLPTQAESELTIADAAGLLQLEPQQIASIPYIASCGVPYQFVELIDVEAVSQAVLDSSLWKRLLGAADVSDLCIYSFSQQSADIRMRMFAPSAGIDEDPATGSAAAALVGGLALRSKQVIPQGWMIEQGQEMGRPSIIGTYVTAGNEGVRSVEVFGSAVLMSKGAFYFS